ncbi:GRM8 [Symbiodinium natans]|uniref:GRM8 protein n=1 Tax=Symbiodinium natans TaxID=878477 RepID=A0A812V5H4_9DINO|nr:GRM8 [Symbiodinium natans]
MASCSRTSGRRRLWCTSSATEDLMQKGRGWHLARFTACIQKPHSSWRQRPAKQRAQGRDRLVCVGVDALPAIIFLILLPFLLLLLVSCASQDPNQESLNRFTATAIFGQILMSLQALGLMKELSIDWQEHAGWLRS